jgi:hypothetical protein
VAGGGGSAATSAARAAGALGAAIGADRFPGATRAPAVCSGVGTASHHTVAATIRPPIASAMERRPGHAAAGGGGRRWVTDSPS